MITYLNLRDSNGVETVDELNSNDFNSSKEFNEELKRLIKEVIIFRVKAYISLSVGGIIELNLVIPAGFNLISLLKTLNIFCRNCGIGIVPVLVVGCLI